jgi:hypothetical protein
MPLINFGHPHDTRIGERHRPVVSRMAARIAAEAREIFGIRSKVRSTRIHRSVSALL